MWVWLVLASSVSCALGWVLHAMVHDRPYPAAYTVLPTVTELNAAVSDGWPPDRRTLDDEGGFLT